MDRIRDILEKQLNKELHQIVLSSPRKGLEVQKIKIRPILMKGELFFQAESYTAKQVFHKNMKKQEAREWIMKQLENSMRQFLLESSTVMVTGLISKKGTVTLKEKKTLAARKIQSLEHNRKKCYILPEGVPVPFLVDLGVQTKEGKIVNAKYDKFRQINRFLEFIQDIVDELPKNRKITIVDFGCGKSYLTFAMYYYLKEMKGYDIRAIGLDLKEEVIEHCRQLKERYGYDQLEFTTGDIASYKGVSQVDMVVTLHACDTATDYALEKAVKWNAKVILSVPCCQHQLNAQLKNESLMPVLKYGLLKERMAALITDGLRAELLEQYGYDTQVLEFIDMEHTPKNILIRGVKRREAADPNLEKYNICCETLQVKPILASLLEK